ncbi:MULTISPECIES: isoleucine--tRNA ligase [unclassified Granulicatella]|uniref:isoleucine--tRNA ligase n=1 Tax=unclassified Granulicatella TaxID=2630493 RepID=UPI001073A3D8|nr:MULTISPECIES: isoleucine--tRNA ligase [unclassified Granulicatella]MBF0780412.1 isoleucine--tRNA ligase [Granulicatella sp. 19428wC4_WM01]TFU95449.1 isoleucine--tRNA ligase [Granulicatella sp. WM01]
MKMKDTLLLGKTEFPMRANLPVREAEWQKNWEEDNLYQKIQAKNEGKESFILHDGPPYANGPIHMGHALNKVSKDFIVRSKSMAGYRAPFVPGWDTHGLPIEQALTNSEGVDRKKLSVAEFRHLCEEYAWKQIENQRTVLKRLGLQGDWDNPYVTLDPKFEEAQIRLFGKMAEKGYIYKGLKPIYWSPSSESSLAEAEIEYKDVESPSIYVAFKVKDGKGLLDENTSFVIWTTTPWTLPANLGIFVHPDFDYIHIKVSNRQFVVAKELLSSVSQATGWENVEIIREFKGQELEYMVAQHPFYERESLVMVGDYVTLDAGTGLVHSAPGHGEDDYHYSRKYQLDVLSPIDNQGHYTDEAPGFEGMFYMKANKVVCELLEEKGALLSLSYFVHSYPHDWRTKKPVIFRATPQWFVSIDKFRQDILHEIEHHVTWYHPSGKVRIYNMVRDRGDWVISRQRAWGVPLPIFYAENGEAIITPETISHVAKLIGEHGSTVWFEREAKELLPDGFTHEGSPNGLFTKEKDIMDVWFDSGSSHAGVLKQRAELNFPADLYLEGSDQYRGWFNSSLTTSVAVNGVAPYKAVLSQGFVNDGQGRKMSKSLGNVIDPAKEMQTKGADIIRLWVSSVDSESDVRVSDDILKQVSEVYRKIRNTMRFMLANTSDFNPVEHRVPYENLRLVDQYMEIRLNQLVDSILAHYHDYKFSAIYREVINFCTVDLSSFYLDFAKDVVYIETENNTERRAMQTVMYDVLVKLTKLLTPIMPFTAEEIWALLSEKEEYVQLADFPIVETYANEQDVLAYWNKFFTIRDVVLKSLEEARNEKIIGKSFEAALSIYTNSDYQAILNHSDVNVAQILIVSHVDVLPIGKASIETISDIHVVVNKAKGHVCDRCRAVKEEVGTIEEAPSLCERCAKIVTTEFPEALVEQEDNQ